MCRYARIFIRFSYRAYQNRLGTENHEYIKYDFCAQENRNGIQISNISEIRRSILYIQYFSGSCSKTNGNNVLVLVLKYNTIG
jgi:hypothetical protein